MWFSRMAYLRAERELICVAVPSSFYRDQVKQRYLNEIQSTFEDISGAHILIEFEINKSVSTAPSIRTASLDSMEGTINEVRNLVAPSNIAGNEFSTFSNHPSPQNVPVRPRSDKPPMLNPDYTFDNYVIGDNNAFAANAAMAVVRQPGHSYNPFLVYGGVGLGKTHLIQSIGNFIHNQSPDKKIIYVQMETFTNEFVFALRDGKTQVFKNKYRNADVLLIDDIHFIQGKTETQEELFNTFNALYENKKQLVFTCDRPVSEIKDITDRLKNRFERGLNVDLQLPSYETRLAILKKKSDQWGITIPEESLHIICNNITTNIRDLEKALTKLRAYVELVNKDITPDITKQQLKDFFSSTSKKNITIELIIREVSMYFNLTPQDLKNKKRNQSVAWPRQVAMYISRQLTEYSTTEIGTEFGGRDHSTVMHGCQKVAEQMKSDPTVEPYINELVRKIRQEGSRS